MLSTALRSHFPTRFRHDAAMRLRVAFVALRPDKTLRGLNDAWYKSGDI
jgi:hypothetical protein